MSRQREAVKIINHGGGPAAKVTAMVGMALGALAGAGAKTAFDRHPQAVPGSARRDIDGPSDRGGQDQNKGGGKGPISAFDRDATGVKKRGNVKDKIVSFAEKHNWRWLGRTMQVQARYAELQGNNLAAAVTLQAFLALFPMLLVAAAVIGWIVNAQGAEVTDRIVNATGLQGEAQQTMREALATASTNRKTSSVLGLLTLFWSALGVSAAIQYAYNQVWQTTGRGMKDKAVGAAWMGGAAILLLATAASTTILHWLPAAVGIIGTAIGLFINFVLWIYTAKILPNVDVSWKELIPGAILGVIGLEILKFLGSVWVPKAVASSSELYGTMGVVLAVLAWLWLFGKLLVYTAAVNTVYYEGRHGVESAEIEMPKPAAAKARGDDVARSGRANS